MVPEDELHMPTVAFVQDLYDFTAGQVIHVRKQIHEGLLDYGQAFQLSTTILKGVFHHVQAILDRKERRLARFQLQVERSMQVSSQFQIDIYMIICRVCESRF